MSDDTIEGMMPAQPKTAPREKAAAAGSNLSAQIEQAVDREPHDWIRCVRVFGDFYRCNWWSRKGQKREGQDFDWGGLITDHIRKSRFLKVTMQGGRLVMDEVRESANRNDRNPVAFAEPTPYNADVAEPASQPLGNEKFSSSDD